MRFKWRNILIILGLLLAVVLLLDFNRRMEELNRLTDQLNSVRIEATKVIQTQTALAGMVAYATSDQAVEEWAYENRMVLPGEHPVVLVPGATGIPTPGIVALATPEQPPNWQIWWELFFGKRP